MYHFLHSRLRHVFTGFYRLYFRDMHDTVTKLERPIKFIVFMCRFYVRSFRELLRVLLRVTIPFPSRNFSKIPVPVGFLLKIPGFLLKIPGFLLKIPVKVIKIPVNKKIGIYRFKKNRFKPPYVAVCSPCSGSG